MAALAGPNPAVKYIQPKVQRRLGRVLIRIQQYEKLLKTFLVNSGVEGTVESIPAFRAKREKRYKNMTLGTLIAEAKKLLLRTAPLPEDADPDPVADQVFLRLRHSMQFTPERAALLIADLEKLRNVRNDLVHHFLGQFDISSTEGCKAALSHLDESYRTVDAALIQLARWMESAQATRKLLSNIIQSKQFQDFLMTDPSTLPEVNDGTS